MKPNLFKWATSELSQDAFICWLIEWAKPEHKGELLNQCASKLIEDISDIEPSTIENLDVKRQYKNIDILVVVNENKAILIEDKVHTKNHGNQLLRYAELLGKEFEKENISLVYFKTGDQSNYREVEEKGYRTYKRSDFLSLLKSGEKEGIKNEIFLDFLTYLNRIDDSVNSYQNLPISEWHWDSWKGFYIELQKQLKQGDWDYVPQKNGGFLGFWWNGNSKEFDDTKFEYYLQLEQSKLCFKLYPHNRERAREIRSFYRSLLYSKAEEHNIRIYQNGRIGNYMTVAALSEDVRKTDENGIIDIEKTIQEIKRIQKMINEI